LRAGSAMRGFERLLVPLDLASFSSHVFDVAVSLARRSGGGLEAFHVVAPEQALLQSRAHQLEALQRCVEPAQTQGIPVDTAVAEGDVAETIVAEAGNWRADLVVIGARAYRTTSGWHLGSVTQRVIRESPCPVLAVPRPAEGFQAGSALPFEKILCPVDFSEPSRRALDYALDLARGTSARLTLLHVLEWFPEEAGDAPLYVPEYHLDLGEDARQRLRGVLPEEMLLRGGHEELVATGVPYRAILEVWRQRGADVIVLGIHGRRALDRVLSGATAAHVLREASCPVLAVSPH